MKYIANQGTLAEYKTVHQNSWIYLIFSIAGLFIGIQALPPKKPLNLFGEIGFSYISLSILVYSGSCSIWVKSDEIRLSLMMLFFNEYVTFDLVSEQHP